MVRPDFLPGTVMDISFNRDRRFFRASLDGGIGQITENLDGRDKMREALGKITSACSTTST